MNNYLPLSGGQLTGAAISRNVQTSELQINGGTEVYQGGSLIAYGNDVNELSGCFKIIASTDSSSVFGLVGTPTGSLTWGGQNIDVIDSQGTNWIRYSSGIQICWGVYSRTSTDSVTINFPKAFVGDPGVTVSGQSTTLFAGGWSPGYVVIGNTNTAGWFIYTAIGRWK